MVTVITGAAGFVGQAVWRAALARPDIGRLRLVDRAAFASPDPRCEVVVTDLSDADGWHALLTGADAIIHLAALPSGASETDPARSERINLLGTLGLLRALQGRAIRLVYSSSIAALGSQLPARVNDATQPVPNLTYGTHKLMSELAITDAVRRGQVDAIALRLPGIVARPRSDGGFRSAFLSDMFWKIRAREPVTLPCGPQGTPWLVSRAVCAANLVHALTVKSPQPVMTLPALRMRIADLIGEICRQAGAEESLVRYEPDPVIEQKFAAYPPLDTPLADSLGFRRDADVPALVAAALQGLA